MFTKVWRAVSYPAKPPSGIEGGAIWIECDPEELNWNHLAELESAVARANMDWRSSRAAQRAVQL
jgi:hypothetical protein